MDHMNFHRLRGDLKALSAALGIGGLITMGAVTVAHPTMAAGTSSDIWTAELISRWFRRHVCSPLPRPQYIVDRCAWATGHHRAHNNC